MADRETWNGIKNELDGVRAQFAFADELHFLAEQKLATIRMQIARGELHTHSVGGDVAVIQQDFSEVEPFADLYDAILADGQQVRGQLFALATWDAPDEFYERFPFDPKGVLHEIKVARLAGVQVDIDALHTSLGRSEPSAWLNLVTEGEMSPISSEKKSFAEPRVDNMYADPDKERVVVPNQGRIKYRGLVAERAMMKGYNHEQRMTHQILLGDEQVTLWFARNSLSPQLEQARLVLAEQAAARVSRVVRTR